NGEDVTPTNGLLDTRNSTPDFVTVVVQGSNSPDSFVPTADGGFRQVVRAGSNVVLDDTASTDGVGDRGTLFRQWIQVNRATTITRDPNTNQMKVGGQSVEFDLAGRPIIHEDGTLLLRRVSAVNTESLFVPVPRISATSALRVSFIQSLFAVDGAGNRSSISADNIGGGASFQRPVSIVNGQNNDIYVLDQATRSIVRVNVTNGNRTPLSENFTNPLAMSTFGTPFSDNSNQANDLYVLDSGTDSIIRVNSTGNKMSFTGTTPLGGAIDMVQLSSTEFAVLLPNSILRVTSAGARTVLSSSAVVPAFSRATAIAANTAVPGNVYVLDRGNNALFEVNVSTGARTIILSGTVGDAGAVKFSTPEDITVEASGTVLLTDSTLNAVLRIDPSVAPNTTSVRISDGAVGSPLITPSTLLVRGSNILVFNDQNPVTFVAPSIVNVPGFDGTLSFVLAVRDSTGNFSVADAVNLTVVDEAAMLIGPGASSRLIIVSATSRRGSNQISVVFSEGVSSSVGTGTALSASNFQLLDFAGTRTITSVEHTPGSSVVTLTVNPAFDETNVGHDLVAPVAGTINNSTGTQMARANAVRIENRTRFLPTFQVGERIAISGTNSSDDDSVTSFQWRQVAGPNLSFNAALNVISVTPTMPGTYAFELRVTDRQSLLSDPSRIEFIVVNSGQIRPTVVAQGSAGAAQGNRILVTSLQPVSLQSRVTGSGPFTIVWSQVDGPRVGLNSAGQVFDPQSQTNPVNASFTPVIAGTYGFNVEVIDSQGVSTTTLVTVAVDDGNNRTPTIEIGAVGNVGLGGNGTAGVSLSAGANDRDGDRLLFSWNQLAGPPVALNNGGTTRDGTINFTVRAAGEYSFQVYASDGLSRSNGAIVTFTVEPATVVVGDAPRAPLRSSSGGGCSVSSAPIADTWENILGGLLPYLLMLVFLGFYRRRS
ncbi:MAG: hypothetical protein P1V97_23680, partial [Planctomycetota bacterium]|nr:hypothetical protein [Planctomycetota bacterium]